MTTLHAPMPTHPYNRRPNPILRSKTAEEPATAPATPAPSGRTSIRTRARTHKEDSLGSGPWQHMAQTYAWVVEQEGLKLQKKNRKTEQWVLAQQLFTKPQPSQHDGGLTDDVFQQKVWEELLCGYEVDAERWMRHEEEARRVAMERERENKKRGIQEELRRIDARIRQRKNDEKQKMAAERLRAYNELRDREKRDRARAEKAAAEAWRAYEDRWAALAVSSGALTFGDIPWPLVCAPGAPAGITPAGIVMFLFSALPGGQSRKDRIRGSQLRWHPDRFGRLMGRVVERDKGAVEEGVGVVARCLNDLMAREARLSQHAA